MHIYLCLNIMFTGLVLSSMECSQYKNFIANNLTLCAIVKIFIDLQRAQLINEPSLRTTPKCLEMAGNMAP